MGEFADDELERALAWRDQYECEWELPELKECQWCGLPGLVWENRNKKWVLVDVHGERHLCENRPMSKSAEMLRASLKFKDM